MARESILGTAGHIDHGKTSLVKALTGHDCDRLPEEKARGITIDIGFAHLNLPGLRVGIVDVPGHEKFIRNMLAGATGIDVALLIVAADDSVMPQTREHLEILKLLGIDHGIIALTKADLVDESQLEIVKEDIRDLVKGSFLETAPLIPTSAHTGRGIAELKEEIRKLVEPLEKTRDRGFFRMGIDRCFVLQGHGAVVTGSVTSGNIKVGEEVEWLPRGELVRVRGLHHHDQAVEQVRWGMRAAINLAGVKHEDLARGQELATPGYLKPTRVLTVHLQALGSLPKPLRHRLPLRLHLGTSEVMATVSLLDVDSAQPGQKVLAQLFLEEPVMATWGQPFVVRDVSAVSTLGGGKVLQPYARKIRRRHFDLLVQLEQLTDSEIWKRVDTALWFAGLEGLEPLALARDAGLTQAQLQEVLPELETRGIALKLAGGKGAPHYLHRGPIQGIESKILTILDRLHQQNPLMTTHDRNHVESQLAWLEAPDLVHKVVDDLIKRKVLAGSAKRIGRTEFAPKLSNSQRKLKDKIVEAHKQSRFQPPEPASFAALAGGQASHLKELFAVAIMEEDLVKVGDNVHLHVDWEKEMRALVGKALADRAAQGGGLTVAEIRDILGTTRKYAVPFCEYLDSVGLTRREGDLRFAATPQTALATPGT